MPVIHEFTKTSDENVFVVEAHIVSFYQVNEDESLMNLTAGTQLRLKENVDYIKSVLEAN